MLISGGIEEVVAPAGPLGLRDCDIAAISPTAEHLVLVAGPSEQEELASRFESRISCATVCLTPRPTLVARVREALSSAPAGASQPKTKTKTSDGEEGRVDVVSGEVRFESPQRSWRIRGASRSKGYETLRANVMVSDRRSGRFHVDSIDLYSSRQRVAFVSVCAEELGASPDQVAAEVGCVLLQAEQAADAASGEPVLVPPKMSDEERAEAMAMLTSPDLTSRIVTDVCSLGVVGEEDNALLMYLALVSRKSEKPLSVVVQSSSSSGKSTLADAISSLVPEEDKVSYSALTGQALYYLESTDLAHKVLCVAEEEGAARASYAMKLLVSQGKIAIASTSKDKETARLVTRTYEVRGPVSLLMTTTAPHLDEELASRLVTLAVAESVAQTREVHAAQRASYSAEALLSRTRRDEILARHHNAQRLLDPLPVVIPMAQELSYADATTRSRRDHDKYLSLIAASALLHQHQREKKTLDGALTYVEATWADVELAEHLAKGVIIRSTSELTAATASLLLSLSEWTGSSPFTRRQAREALGLGDTQLKVHLARLVELEYVVVTRKARSVSYELAWNASGGHENTERPMRSGQTAIRSGSGRGQVGPRSGGGRGAPRGPSSLAGRTEAHRSGSDHEERAYEGETNSPYVRREYPEAGEPTR
jgi:hypothetical protein